MINTESLVKNLQSVKLRIAAAAAKAKQDASRIKIMAVTKTFPVEIVKTASGAGINLFGENRVQEASGKYGALDFPHELHLIGHLQQNKAKIAVALFDCIESVDKLQTALAINKEAARINKVINILVEINTSGEATKSGITIESAYFPLLEQLLTLENLQVRGLMTVGPFTEQKAESRRAFACLRKLFVKTVENYALPGFDILSMGMSSDFEAAIEEGANQVRLGTVLFGSR